MVAGLGGGEGELATRAATLGDDAVVVVEEFLERGEGFVSYYRSKGVSG